PPRLADVVRGAGELSIQPLVRKFHGAAVAGRARGRAPAQIQSLPERAAQVYPRARVSVSLHAMGVAGLVDAGGTGDLLPCGKSEMRNHSLTIRATTVREWFPSGKTGHRVRFPQKALAGAICG